MSFALPVLNMRAEGTNPPPKLSDFVLFFPVRHPSTERPPRKRGKLLMTAMLFMNVFLSIVDQFLLTILIKSQDFLRNSHSLNLSEYLAGTRASTSTPPVRVFLRRHRRQRVQQRELGVLRMGDKKPHKRGGFPQLPPQSARPALQFRALCAPTLRRHRGNRARARSACAVGSGVDFIEYCQYPLLIGAKLFKHAKGGAGMLQGVRV